MEFCFIIFFIFILFLGNIRVRNNYLLDCRFAVVSVVLVQY